MLISFAIVSKMIEIRSAVSDTELRADKASRFSQSSDVFATCTTMFRRVSVLAQNRAEKRRKKSASPLVYHRVCSPPLYFLHLNILSIHFPLALGKSRVYNVVSPFNSESTAEAGGRALFADLIPVS